MEEKKEVARKKKAHGRGSVGLCVGWGSGLSAAAPAGAAARPLVIKEAIALLIGLALLFEFLDPLVPVLDALGAGLVLLVQLAVADDQLALGREDQEFGRSFVFDS